MSLILRYRQLHPEAATNIDAAADTNPPRDRTTRTDKALAHCRKQWEMAYDDAWSRGLTEAKALRLACIAYKLAMPPLVDLPAIRAAIACTAQGIQLEVFDGRDGSQLLYAAQVAMSLLKRKEPRK